MSIPVDFLPKAYDDLLSLAGGFLDVNPTLGNRFLNAVSTSVQRISNHPELGGRCLFSDASLPHLRVWPIQDFRRYLLVYRVEQNGVQIVRLLDGKSDWMNYLMGG